MSLCVDRAHSSQRGPGFHPIITSEIWEIKSIVKGLLFAPTFKRQALRDASFLWTKRLQVPHPRENIQETGPDLLSQC